MYDDENMSVEDNKGVNEQHGSFIKAFEEFANQDNKKAEALLEVFQEILGQAQDAKKPEEEQQNENINRFFATQAKDNSSIPYIDNAEKMNSRHSRSKSC